MSQSAKSRWPRIRKFFNDVHLWLGLASGLIVIAVCFSGTVYVYNTELTEASLSHLYKVSPQQGQTLLHIDTLVARLRSQQEGVLTGASIPASATRSYQFTLKKEGSERGTTYMVNPYTG
ncbi:MAG: PepSY domain-containing protein, partial [Chitinophagaceae bacterium]|nr:PepSY domain-containing protein [Chitinophagaceae bacterium]